jgi:hypothetical protein
LCVYCICTLLLSTEQNADALSLSCEQFVACSIQHFINCDVALLRRLFCTFDTCRPPTGRLKHPLLSACLLAVHKAAAAVLAAELQRAFLQGRRGDAAATFAAQTHHASDGAGSDSDISDDELYSNSSSSSRCPVRITVAERRKREASWRQLKGAFDLFNAAGDGQGVRCADVEGIFYTCCLSDAESAATSVLLAPKLRALEAAAAASSGGASVGCVVLVQSCQFEAVFAQDWTVIDTFAAQMERAHELVVQLMYPTTLLMVGTAAAAREHSTALGNEREAVSLSQRQRERGRSNSQLAKLR